MTMITWDSDTPYLPPEIIRYILKCLPVKSLIRFRCVCKDWKNLFKTPSFISEHLHHSPCLLVERNGGKLCLINRDMQVLDYQTLPFSDSSMDSCMIVGSSNGLLCLKHSKSQSYFLWNPATRELLQVPKVFVESKPRWTCYVGFGYSAIVNDYKIVRVLIYCLDDESDYFMEVFSLTTKSWKKVELGKLWGIIPFRNDSCFTFNGAIFWFGFTHVMGGGIAILSFDIATELFTLIRLPIYAVWAYNRLTTYDNKLAMLSNDKIGFDRSSLNNLWVINLSLLEKCVDASGERWIWTKIYRSNPYHHSCLSLSALAIRRNEIVLEHNPFHVFFRVAKGIVDKEEEKLVLCNLHTNEFKMLAIDKYPIKPILVWNYEQSLASVGNHHIETSSS